MSGNPALKKMKYRAKSIGICIMIINMLAKGLTLCSLYSSIVRRAGSFFFFFYFFLFSFFFSSHFFLLPTLLLCPACFFLFFFFFFFLFSFQSRSNFLHPRKRRLAGQWSCIGS